METLTTVEARVLACLVEKERTTPDYYPLSLHALAAACNQKNNRNPVMHLSEEDVASALDGLRRKQLVWETAVAGSRVPKYQHRFAERYPVEPQQLAVLCELMLRGPQTPGELRSRAARIVPFETLDAVTTTLDALAAAPDGPYVVILPREAGKREQRYAHLLCGEVEVDESRLQPAPEPARVVALERDERIATLEERVAGIESELGSLREMFDTFRKQFE